jgi:endonuclease/exonuclease/phosphatase family metal-dependent hydrolase
MTKLSLLTLNIERRKHLGLIKPFLHSEKPEVAAFQEIFEDTFEDLKQELGMDGIFVPRVRHHHEEGLEGMALLSAYPIKQHWEFEYDTFTELYPGLEHVLTTRPRVWLIVAEIEKEGQIFRVATTHFTWSNNGDVTEDQKVNLEKLLTLTKPYEDLVLVGDFNTPRGKEIFTVLSTHFKDTIPPEVHTTIDGARHRAGALQLVVDGVFSRGYDVKNVQIHDGLSDHYGITAQVYLA